MVLPQVAVSRRTAISASQAAQSGRMLSSNAARGEWLSGKFSIVLDRARADVEVGAGYQLHHVRHVFEPGSGLSIQVKRSGRTARRSPPRLLGLGRVVHRHG